MSFHEHRFSFAHVIAVLAFALGTSVGYGAEAIDTARLFGVEAVPYEKICAPDADQAPGFDAAAFKELYVRMYSSRGKFGYLTLAGQIRGRVMAQGLPDCGMSDAELVAIAGYTAKAYVEVNLALRQSAGASENMRPYVATLNSALAKLRRFEGVVYRYSWLPDEALAEHVEGAIVTYVAYTSTAQTPPNPRDFAGHRFVIHSKNGRAIDRFSMVPQELEVLFAAGTRFRVLKRAPIENGRFEFELEEL